MHLPYPTRNFTSKLSISAKKTRKQTGERNERYVKRIIDKKRRMRDEAKKIYDEDTRHDPKIEEVHQIIAGEVRGLLSPGVGKLLRQRSMGMATRYPEGTTSCRHLQMLFLLYEIANCIATIKKDSGVRQLLSQLWRGAVEPPGELHQFYSRNEVNGDIPYTILTEDNFETIFDGRCIFPMGLITPYGEQYRIFHYFIVLKEGEEYFIYNANGSDYLQAHPMKIKIEQNVFLNFINAVNMNDKQTMDPFILTYFMEGATIPFYFDEGCNRTTFMSIFKGKGEELLRYGNFRVAFFPELREQLIREAVGRFYTILHQQSIEKCMDEIIDKDCIHVTFEHGNENSEVKDEWVDEKVDGLDETPGVEGNRHDEENEKVDGGRFKKIDKGKKRTKKRRLKLKARPFSKRMKR